MMRMSRSPYTNTAILTNKHSGRRTHKVQAFVLHIMAARWTGERCARYFAYENPNPASANYCIGYDGDVALNVEEHNRAWTTSSPWADNRAITYELANSKAGYPWPVTDKTIEKAIVMLAEQHKRYGLKKASYTGDTNGTLWRHDWFAKTECPGPYLAGKLKYIADEVNKILLRDSKKVTTQSVKKEAINKVVKMDTWKWARVYEKPSFDSKVVNSKAKGSSVSVSKYAYGDKDANGLSVWLLVDDGKTNRGYMHGNNFLPYRKNEIRLDHSHKN